MKGNGEVHHSNISTQLLLLDIFIGIVGSESVRYCVFKCQHCVGVIS